MFLCARNAGVFWGVGGVSGIVSSRRKATHFVSAVACISQCRAQESAWVNN